MCSLIMDNYLKEILAFVYYGSIVNNRSKILHNNNEDVCSWLSKSQHR